VWVKKKIQDPSESMGKWPLPMSRWTDAALMQINAGINQCQGGLVGGCWEDCARSELYYLFIQVLEYY
jgi:hypothetical protein